MGLLNVRVDQLGQGAFCGYQVRLVLIVRLLLVWVGLLSIGRFPLASVAFCGCTILLVAIRLAILLLVENGVVDSRACSLRLLI